MQSPCPLPSPDTASPPQVNSEKLEPLEEDSHFAYAMEGDDTVADLFADGLQ